MTHADTLRTLHGYASTGAVANYSAMLDAAAELDYLTEQVNALRGENDELRADLAKLDAASAPAPTTPLPPALAELIATRQPELDARIAAIGDYGRTMLAATAHTAVECPRCGARPGEWCTSNRHGVSGKAGYTDSAVRHRARLRLAEDWSDEDKTRASAAAGVYQHNTALTTT